MKMKHFFQWQIIAIQIVITLAVHNDWELEQVNVDRAYLNMTSKETIYMHLPKGYNEPGKQNFVKKLLKGLYELKQGGQEWYEHLCAIIVQLAFTWYKTETAVFVWQ